MHHAKNSPPITIPYHILNIPCKFIPTHPNASPYAMTMNTPYLNSSSPYLKAKTHFHKWIVSSPYLHSHLPNKAWLKAHNLHAPNSPPTLKFKASLSTNTNTQFHTHKSKLNLQRDMLVKHPKVASLAQTPRSSRTQTQFHTHPEMKTKSSSRNAGNFARLLIKNKYWRSRKRKIGDSQDLYI